MTNHTFKAEPNSLGTTSTYIFEAPREKVFAAYTNLNLIPKWWGEGDATTVETMDVKPGGSWRFTMAAGGDQTIAFRGVYHTVKPSERLVNTWQYEGAPIVAMETIDFEALDGGKTKVTNRTVFASVEDRDNMMKSGMDENAMLAMMDRLTKLV